MAHQNRDEEKQRFVELLGSMTYFAPKDYINRLDIDWCADYLLSHGAIMPPCKVGDTVYVISSFADDNVHTGVVERMCIDEEGTEIIIVGNDWFVDAIGVCRSPSDFGKTVFLTHEEAVAALERMKK